MDVFENLAAGGIMGHHSMQDSQQLNVVTPKVFRELCATGAVQGATIRAAEGGAGLIIVADVGQQHRILGQAKVRSPRLFMSLDAAASALQQYGITTFRGETEGWTPRYQTYRNGGA